jgi:arabinose-5-phosphate isomerase
MPKPALKSVKKTVHDDIVAARGTLALEIDGLMALSNSLNGDFVRAVDAIDAMRNSRAGRLIVSGMGKSGHVARKMVATFASTGVPAHFVHPGEASHGDLGMIAQQDVVILISNSGESSELNDLLQYTRRFGITMIAVTGKRGSTLAQHADIVLELPDVPEAFSAVKAPTTSTTMTLALGDALAEALMNRMGLTPEQFKVFHPAGKLGQQLLKVSEIMLSGDKLPIVAETATMDKAIVVMTQKNVGCVIVCGPGKKLAGIITDGDLKRHMGPKLLTQKVTRIMSKKPITVVADVLGVEAVNMMLNRKNGPITSLIVADKGVVKGLIRVQDCLQAGLI